MLDQMFRSKLKSDSMFNLTPDMPKLRFNGPINVFMWGKYSRFEVLFDIFKELGCESIKDWKSLETFTHTRTEHVLLDNQNYDKTKGGFQQFVPESWGEVKSFISDLTPAPLCGRLLSVSLKGMRALDTHFNNTITFGRKIIPTEDGTQAWSYFIPERNLLKYDPHAKVYYPLTHLSLKRAPLHVKGDLVRYGAT